MATIYLRMRKPCPEYVDFLGLECLRHCICVDRKMEKEKEGREGVSLVEDWIQLQTSKLKLSSRMGVSAFGVVSYIVFTGIKVGSCLSGGTVKEL